MKWILACMLILLLTGCSRQPNVIYINADTPAPVSTYNRSQITNCTLNAVYPDYRCTPGAIFISATKEVICVSGYTKTVRDVPESLKDQVYESYGIYVRQPYEYEIDHLISLELGGSNDIGNLWPEKYNDTLGARVKDKVENLLHKKVCEGSISLEQAQYDIAYNWTKYVGEK